MMNGELDHDSYVYITFETQSDPIDKIELYNDREPDLLLEYQGPVGELKHVYLARIHKGEHDMERSKEFLTRIFGAMAGVKDVQLVTTGQRVKR